jgi:hypothetical protein
MCIAIGNLRKINVEKVFFSVARFFLLQHTKTGENKPNNQKYIKWPQNIPNGRKIYRHLPLQVPPKFTQIRYDFWLENMPSGNPGIFASEISAHPSFIPSAGDCVL